MRKGLVVAAIVIAVALAVPTALAQSSKVYLKADLQHAVVIWNRPLWLGKFYRGGVTGGATTMNIVVGTDDISKVATGPIVYIVINVKRVDLYHGSPIPVWVAICAAWHSTPACVYTSPSISVAAPGQYEIPVPSDALIRAAKTWGAARIMLQVPWFWRVDAKAPDHSYGLLIDRVLLAPAVTATITSETPRTTIVMPQPQTMAAHITANSGSHSSAATYAAIGIGIIAIGIAIAAFVMHTHAHRHR